MSQEPLLKKIRLKARQDRKNRRDLRFIGTMGLLVAKGLLKTNYPVLPTPNKHIRIEDAIWAGRNVEPRILEVLPAAVLRLEKHFDLNPAQHVELAKIISQLRKRQDNGDDFHGIPYKKIRQWLDFPLKDKRTKPMVDKKVPRTFRLKPEAVAQLEKMASDLKCSVTEALERKILSR